MGWCKEFKRNININNIEFIEVDKRWVFYTAHEPEFEIEIKYCPFCGATMTNEDI